MNIKKFLLILALLITSLLVVSCNSPSDVFPQGETVSVDEIYTAAEETAFEVIRSRISLRSFLVAASISIILIVFASLGGAEPKHFGAILLMGLFAYLLLQSNLSERASVGARELAVSAITEGVDRAREAQSTNLQTIHAVIKGYGVETETCVRTVNYRDFCSANTPYYSTAQINPHDCNCRNVCTSRDSNGNCQSERRECDTCYDTEYTPYFAHVLRYWVIPDTQARFLHSGIYNMSFADPKSAPTVYLTDWRAPENPGANLYRGRTMGRHWQFDNRVPEFWTRVKNAANANATVVVGNFVSPYFHWGFGAESATYSTYAGYYRQMSELVDLPAISGQSVTYTDAFGKKSTINVPLTSTDGEQVALDMNLVSFLGFTPSPQLAQQMQEAAMEAQGNLGVAKQVSVHWFFVSDWVVQDLGGIMNTTFALKAYLEDTAKQGLFRLPKNKVIIVQRISDDGSLILERNLDTGMPYGNVLVAQEMRLSIPTGTNVPFTREHAFGTFTGTYVGQQGSALQYQYSDMAASEAVLGMLYKPNVGWEAPDPDSDECSTVPAEHYGIIRHSMCTQEYRKTTIKINGDGANLIVRITAKTAEQRVSLVFAWLFFVSSICFGAYLFTQKR